MQSIENTLKKYGYPTSNLRNTRRCGAKTRKGIPCKGPAVRDKKRCRMHGGTNPGRPRDPLVQKMKYYRMKRNYITKVCINCTLVNQDCFRIHVGECLPEDFERRIKKYCHAFNQMKSSGSI